MNLPELSERGLLFKALDRMDSSRVHLHLQHPFVQHILSRFLAQGYNAQDLSRVTIVRNPEDALVRVIAFGRLSLSARARFGSTTSSFRSPRWLETFF